MSARSRLFRTATCVTSMVVATCGPGSPPPSPVEVPQTSNGVVVNTLAEVDGGSGGMSIDADGNIYSSDFGSKLGSGGTAGTRVFRITPDGATSVFADGFEGASGSEIDNDGNLYVANFNNGDVVRVTPEAEASRLVTLPGNNNGHLV